MTSRRILVTGLSTSWGSRLAQALEQDPAVEAVIGVDRTPPKVELERTEFVRVADSQSLIRRIVEAAEVDTVVDTRLVADSVVTTARRAHENNVIGTLNVLAACGGADSPVRKVVFRSSAHVYGAEQDDPAFFTEETRRRHAPRTAIERDVVEAEGAVADFAARHPDVTVTVLRFADALGPGVRSSLMALLGLPVVPTILGFEPRFQVLHADDVAGSLLHAVRHDLDGAFNCAADGVLGLGEALGLLGKPAAPVLPPWGTGLAAAVVSRAGVRLPPELLGLLRYGRGLDNRRLKATGYRFTRTTRETVLDLRRQQRLARFRQDQPAYRYEREVEEFLRFSPSVRRDGASAAARGLLAGAGAEAPAANRPAGAALGGNGIDDLPATDLLALLPSLPAGDLAALAAHERAHGARPEVLTAIERLLRAKA